MSFTIGSLFDGSGGFPLAATMCGGTPLWASEVEPFPIAVTWSRFPGMKHLGSVTDVKGDEVEPVDVITFGSPCQDLSVAGKRAGLKHEDNGDEETTRSGLFMEAVRIIKEMRKATNGLYPRFAIWENVPGAFSSNKGEDFRTVCEELIKIVEPGAVMPAVPKNGWPYADCYCGEGWSLAYRVYDAQYWGVPQRRRRIYLVVDFAGERAGKISFEREGLRGYFTQGRTQGKGTAPDAQSCAGTDDREGNCGVSAGRNGVIEQKQLDAIGFQWQAGAEASLCVGDDLGPSLGCTRVPAVAFHLLQDPVPNEKVSPCMGQGNSNGGQASIGVCYGFDPQACRDVGQYVQEDLGNTLTNGINPGWHNGVAYAVVESVQNGGAMGIDVYNQSITGDKAKTLNAAACDSDHIPCVIGFDSYNLCETGNVGRTVTTPSGGLNEHIPCVIEAMGYDRYNQCSTGNVCETLRTPGGGDNYPVVCYGALASSVATYDARGNGDGQTVNTLTGDHNNRITDYRTIVCEPVPIHDQATRFSGKRGSNQDGKGNGLGVGNPGDPMNTLTGGDRHAVAFQTYQKVTGPLMANSHPGSYTGQDAFSDMLVAGPVGTFQNTGVGWWNETPVGATLRTPCGGDATLANVVVAGVDCRNMNETPELYPTLQAKPNGGQSLNYSGAVRIRYIVRRLTPTECARLQGFADRWAVPVSKDDFTEEEYQFWLQVRNTHAELNGKATKQYTKEQMLSWYNKLHTDSSEYKLWGNGIALPTALYVMQGISDVINQ